MCHKQKERLIPGKTENGRKRQTADGMWPQQRQKEKEMQVLRKGKRHVTNGGVGEEP